MAAQNGHTETVKCLLDATKLYLSYGKWTFLPCTYLYDQEIKAALSASAQNGHTETYGVPLTTKFVVQF